MAEQLNILLITSDQQHFNTLGCLNPEVRTPNLNRLARRDALHPGLLSQSYLYANTSFHDHWQISQPARSLVFRDKTSRERTDSRGNFLQGWIQNGSCRQGTLSASGQHRRISLFGVISYYAGP